MLEKVIWKLSGKSIRSKDTHLFYRKRKRVWITDSININVAPIYSLTLSLSIFNSIFNSIPKLHYEFMVKMQGELKFVEKYCMFWKWEITWIDVNVNSLLKMKKEHQWRKILLKIISSFDTILQSTFVFITLFQMSIGNFVLTDWTRFVRKLRLSWTLKCECAPSCWMS